jgi:hypothetical protein
MMPLFSQNILLIAHTPAPHRIPMRMTASNDGNLLSVCKRYSESFTHIGQLLDLRSFHRYCKSFLHIGQLDLICFHWRMQTVWNRCPHGVCWWYLGSSDSMQIGHVSSV